MWLLLQLSELPAGAFAHSAGLEAAMQTGGLESIERFVDQSLEQAGRASVPFVVAACRSPASLPALDARCDARIASHVGNRASRAQGRALASAASRVFAVNPSSECMHHAPVFGAIAGALAIAPDAAAALYLHGVARGTLSAAVRLGILGPLEAQRIQSSRAGLLEALHASSMRLSLDEAAPTAPLLELFGALHDTLDARLFQS